MNELNLVMELYNSGIESKVDNVVSKTIFCNDFINTRKYKGVGDIWFDNKDFREYHLWNCGVRGELEHMREGVMSECDEEPENLAELMLEFIRYQ